MITRTRDYSTITSVSDPNPKVKIAKLSGSLQKQLLQERMPEKSGIKSANHYLKYGRKIKIKNVRSIGVGLA